MERDRRVIMVVISALVLFAAACKSKPDESKQLSELAQALCPIDRGGAPIIATLPPEVAKHIRHEDVDFVDKSMGDDAGVPSTSTETASCEVRGVDVKSTTAVVTLTRKTSLGVKDYSIAFIKTADDWKADYHLPERAAARTSALQLEQKAALLVDDLQWDEAKAKLQEALKLAPDQEDSIKKQIAAVDELLATRVAGHWFKLTEKDAMTDKENVWVSVPASTTLWSGVVDKRPLLTARCVKGKPDLIIAAEVVVGGSFEGSSIKYRFDSDAPKSEWMGETDDHEGFYASNPRSWFDRLSQHQGKLVVEVPVFEKLPQTITFDLAGSDKALLLVKAACAK